MTGRREPNLNDMGVPTRGDTAIFRDDRAISFVSVTKYPDGREVLMPSVIKPGDADYKKICSEFKLEKRGDQGTKTYHLISEEWVVQPG